MPKKVKPTSSPSGGNTTAELQKSEFPARIAKVKKDTSKVLARGSGASKSEREQAFKAKKAAERVERRLNPSTGKKKPKGKPTKAQRRKTQSSVGARRRRPFEVATGTAVLKGRLEGVNALITAGRKGN